MAAKRVGSSVAMAAFLLAAALLPATAARAQATGPAGRTFYVDFDGGSDDGEGLSAAAAFQHCPGDPNAAGKAKAAALQPGDSVLFKGGVSYRGSVVITWSGAPGKPITFDGNSGRYGAGRAILDGWDVLTGWEACQSAGECGGNPNWKSIYRASVAGPVEPFSSNMYQGEKMCWIAQDPNPRDPFYQDLPDGHRKIVQGEPNAVTDANYFTQPDANAWDGAWLVVFARPNVAYFVPVTGYEPAAHRLAHAGRLTSPTSYAVLNSLRALDTPGEYVIRQEAGRTWVYLWPHDAAELVKTGASLSLRGTGFALQNQKHVEIRGFTIQKYVAAKLSAMGVSAGKCESLVVRDNDVQFGSHGRANGGQGAAIAVNDGQDVLVENNRVVENRRCSGITVNPGRRVVVRGNLVRKSGYAGIWMIRVVQGEIVGNTVTDNRGVHANAISVYTDSSDILVAGNRVFRSVRPFTMEDSNNLTVVNNVFVSDSTMGVGLWNGRGRPQRGHVFLNNIMLGPGGQGLYAVNKVVEGCVFENNIMGSFMGEAAIDANANTLRNNICLDRSQRLFHASEKVQADANALFVDPAKEDYRLKPGSPAVDAGADVGVYPRAAFPDYDFDKDADGRPRKQGAAVDIGPYESSPAKETRD